MDRRSVGRCSAPGDPAGITATGGTRHGRYHLPECGRGGSTGVRRADRGRHHRHQRTAAGACGGGGRTRRDIEPRARLCPHLLRARTMRQGCGEGRAGTGSPEQGRLPRRRRLRFRASGHRRRFRGHHSGRPDPGNRRGGRAQFLQLRRAWLPHGTVGGDRPAGSRLHQRACVHRPRGGGTAP